ncbi:riboflavin-specific deaminase [Pseudomonas moraviensis]|uniref:riboflavin-specific deaminase n=1 Tax=Pseudomonas moraviensis TaxID=321662 RepID=UPI001580CE44|nr:riboflavin-specific deaminase [Pseudomonas moraviensis]
MSLSNEYETYDTDAFLLSMALAQGRRTLAICLPNPPVGCTIVQRLAAVSSGFIRLLGTYHTETMFLPKLELGRSELTACVMLEPSSVVGNLHLCAHSFVKSGFQEVFVEMVDLNPSFTGLPIRFFDCNAEPAKTFFLQRMPYVRPVI